MGTAYEDATCEAVEGLLFGFLAAMKPGCWYSRKWDNVPHTEQSVICGCVKAKLMLFEATPENEFRIKLSAAGEALQHDRQGIIEAWADGAYEPMIVRPWTKPPAIAVGESQQPSEADRAADKKTDTEKKLPPHHVNDCARYIVAQRKLITQGKRPKATKKALIAEHLGDQDTTAMERELQPSRYGWLLNVNGQADK